MSKPELITDKKEYKVGEFTISVEERKSDKQKTIIVFDIKNDVEFSLTIEDDEDLFKYKDLFTNLLTFL